MAIKTFTADLNGGDAITADNDLIYKIYGSTDGYVTAIHSSGSHNTDANVTVTAGVVVVSNVDVGAETLFKISSIDEAANESILSPEFSTANYGVKCVKANSQCIVIAGATKALQLGEFVEFEITDRIPAEENNYLFSNTIGSTTNGFWAIKITSASSINLRAYDSIGAKTSTNYALLAGNNIIKTRITADGLGMEFWLNGVLKTTLSLDTFAYSATTNKVFSAFNTSGALNISSTFDWIKMNTETFELNEGNGVDITGDEATTATGALKNGATWVNL